MGQLRRERSGEATPVIQRQRWDWEPGWDIAYLNSWFPLTFSNVPGPRQLSKLSKEWTGHPCSESPLMAGSEYFWCLREAWRIEQNPGKVCFPSAAHIPGRPPTIWKRSSKAWPSIIHFSWKCLRFHDSSLIPFAIRSLYFDRHRAGPFDQYLLQGGGGAVRSLCWVLARRGWGTLSGAVSYPRSPALWHKLYGRKSGNRVSLCFFSFYFIIWMQ